MGRGGAALGGLGLALGALGWGLLAAALPHDAWGVAGGQASAVATVTVTRGLWRDCAADATGVTSCLELSSLLSLPGYVWGGRALLVAAVALGALGTLVASAGSGCSRLGDGGSRRRARGAAGGLLLLAGLGALAAAAWVAASFTRDFFDPQHPGVRYEPGPGLLTAGGGALLALAGGAVLLGSARAPPRPPRGPPASSLAGDPPRPPGDSAAGGKYGRNVYV